MEIRKEWLTALVQYNTGSLGYHHCTRKRNNRNKKLRFMGGKDKCVHICRRYCHKQRKIIRIKLITKTIKLIKQLLIND